MTFEYEDIKGIKLHFAKAGNGDKLIIFVHGFPEFWYLYKNQLEYFSNEFTVIAPDMRGYNLSSKPAEVEQYQVKYLIEDLRQLAEKSGYKKFILVAHDWGGMIAWWFAIVHPEYVEKLIIINAPHPAIFYRELKENSEQQKASDYMKLLQSPEAEQILSANNYEALEKIVLKEGLKTGMLNEVDKQAYLQAWSQPGALTGSLNYYRAQKDFGYGLDSSTYQVNVPTLVIWGEKDTALLTSNLDGLEQYVPDLIIKRIPDSSHWIIHEMPELVNMHIQEFVS